MNTHIKFIIPAAGYGTRVGSPIAKELLLFNNEPLIKRFIDLGKQLNIRCHIITRKEKINLIQYLEQFDHVDIQIIEPSREWPDTILQSAPYWSDHNILLLPDTDFSPKDTIQSLIQSLEENDISVAAFKADQYQTWGTFKENTPTYQLIEKPQSNESDLLAWGILGFRKEVGKDLFNLILESTFDHQLKKTNYRFAFFRLDFFKDLTR